MSSIQAALDRINSDLRKTEALKPGDACEFRYPARAEWLPATVVHNGGSWYWRVELEAGQEVDGLYIEHVRAPGTNPWSC